MKTTISYGSQFENFLSKYKTNETVKYKGFKITSDWRIRTFQVMKAHRRLLYSHRFFSNLSKNQIFFSIEWGIREYRIKDFKKSYIKTLEYCTILGIDKQEIEDFLTTLTAFNNQEMEVHTPKYKQLIQSIIKPFIKWIKRLLSGHMDIR